MKLARFTRVRALGSCMRPLGALLRAPGAEAHSAVRRCCVASLLALACAASLFAASAFAQAAPASGSGTDLRESFRLLDVPELWIVVLVILPLCALVAWIGYGRESLSPRARVVLSALRFSALLLLLAVVFRPVFVQRREEIKQAEVLLLVDDSASMRRKDVYAGDDKQRAALGALTGRQVESSMRIELARAALEKELIPALKDKGYAPRTLRFADTVEPVEDLSTLSGRGHATHLGSALQQALASHRGRHVTGVVIVSDGRSNGGLSPLEAARVASAAGTPVHTLTVGDTRPERNIVVELAEAPQNALDGDEIQVSVRVLGRGTPPGASAHVILEELVPDREPRPLDEKECELRDEGERIVLFAPPGTPDLRVNERRFRVSVPPLQDETLRDDNAVEFSVHITPEKIRVLYVDAYPRYEYRFLHTLLQRSDANLVVQCYLLSATPDFAQESTRGMPSLTAVPTGRKDLLDNYDVVILGDVNPYAISPDPARCEEFLSSLHEFVERGGGLVFIAGEYDNPRSYVGTPVEELLPVMLDRSGTSSFEGDTTKAFHARLEDPANPNEVVRLAQDVKLNRELWEDEGGLSGFYWFFPVLRAKPGAQVLLRHPTAENTHGRYPLLVTGYFPAGRTLFLAVDETWRWRFQFGDRYHERFWRNAIRWVALGRLKSGDRRVQIDALRTRYNLDERVTLEARVLDEDYRPSERPVQDARMSRPDGSTVELKLNLVPDRPGLYRAAFEVERPGLYGAWIENAGQRVASTEFEVALPSRENADPSPDPSTLQAIASMTGGRALDLSRTRELMAAFPGHEERREPISSELRDAWDNWGTLLAALGLLSAEWILRKRWELI
jgi:uncharacterized membrane protein